MNIPDLTLRDYFAAASLQAEPGHRDQYLYWQGQEVRAEGHYKMADAMLAERNRRQTLMITASEEVLVASIVQSAQEAGVALSSLAQALQAVAQDPSALSGYSTPSGHSAGDGAT